MEQQLACLSLVAPVIAQQQKSFHLWQRFRDTLPLASALELHRDAERGRTHIVLEELLYRPHVKDPCMKFRVLRCGVFRAADIVGTIERILGLEPGAGKGYVECVLERMDPRCADPGPGCGFLQVLSYGESLGAASLNTSACACLRLWSISR